MLASVKKKYPQEVARLSCIVLLLISEEMINGYIAQLADTLEEGSSEREPVSPTLFSLEKGQAE